MGRACLQAGGFLQLSVGQDGCVFVGACGFTADIVGIGDFGVLYLLGTGMLCLVALFFFLAQLIPLATLLASVETLTFFCGVFLGSCLLVAWRHSLCPEDSLHKRLVPGRVS